jgi:serine/threonine protein kinase
MKSERWQHIERLYHAALEQVPAQRSEFLAVTCEGDDDLRRSVEALLSTSGFTDDLVGRAVWEKVAESNEHSNGLVAGTRVGPYKILGPLGEGGMGRVYRGVDTRLDRPVAIKTSIETFSATFDREALAISALNHPNICTLYDVGPNCLVMELVEGETLAERICRVGALPIEEALDIALHVAEALEAAHAKGIVHRDLKPANVKITPEGRVKVLDFGLAKTVGDASHRQNSTLKTTRGIGSVSGQIIGTPAYMSPEQARGKEVDARTDVWAFGCLLYELLVGTRAFSGEGNAEIVAAILARNPDWRALPGNTPAQIRDLLRGCLQKDAANRPQEIKDARIAVELAISRGVWKPTYSKTIAAVVLLLAASAAVWFVRARQAPSAEQLVRSVPLTTYPGSQDWPSLSPDGSAVAFSWDGEKQDNLDIYVKRIGPEPPLRLTRDPAPDRAPTWAPDGSAIAFLRGSGPGKASVVLITPSGEREHVLTKVAVGGPNNQYLAWSPDSKWLAASDLSVEQPAGLWLLSVDTGERRRLTTVPREALQDLNLAFAPDGSALAFTRLVANNSTYLYVLPLMENLRPRGGPHLLSRENQVLGLAWASGGRDLILSSGPPGNLSLFRISTSGEARRTRLTDQGETLNLTISERAKRMVFSQSRREMDIYRAELSKGDVAVQPTPLIASSRLDRYPRYSPDGKKIAFVSLALETGSSGSATTTAGIQSR